MTRKQALLGSLAVLLLLGNDGCQSQANPTDPSDDDLSKAENFDVERTRGRVTNLGVGYFKGDRKETGVRKGRPYYWVVVSHGHDAQGAEITESFSGIPSHIYDALQVGDVLPKKPLLGPLQLTRLDGKVIDRQANLEKGQFYIMVDERKGTPPRTYRVDAATYYRLDIGTWLPLREGEAQGSPPAAIP